MTLHVPVKALGALGGSVAIAICALYVTKSMGQSAAQPQAGSETSPIYGVAIPAGYRDWRVISVGHLTGGSLDLSGGKLEQLRAQLGNDLAIEALRDGKFPLPDGAIIAALHWNEVSSEGNNKVLAGGFPGADLQSSVAASAVNVQFMVKDSKKYAATGGWGFADFKNGKPGDEALHKACFPCHQLAKDRDYIFVHYAPTP
jgi:Cytochrome P460